MPVVPFAPAGATDRQPNQGVAVPPKDQFLAMAAAMMQREAQNRKTNNKNLNPNSDAPANSR